MLDKKQLQDQMTGKVRDELFYRQFYTSLNQRFEEMQSESVKTYAEKVKREDYTTSSVREKPARFSMPNDDGFKTKKWNSLLKDCAYYFD